MAVPKKKVSKQRKRKRNGDKKAPVPSLMVCPSCGDPKLPHRVCPSCGTYRGEQVIDVEEL
ncbi:MAG TPA: 50S ribosomal protein L32 [Longimicrobiales bacterium]|nr:50S ribosomal protein L32 [Longimicrobiales bacterium]